MKIFESIGDLTKPLRVSSRAISQVGSSLSAMDRLEPQAVVARSSIPEVESVWAKPSNVAFVNQCGPYQGCKSSLERRKELVTAPQADFVRLKRIENWRDQPTESRLTRNWTGHSRRDRWSEQISTARHPRCSRTHSTVWLLEMMAN